MNYKNPLLSNTINLTKDARSNALDENGNLAELMSNPEYLRQSSAIINEALKEGFDILQLPNGDIVATGTKIVTNTYVWDAAKGSLTKARASAGKPRGRKPKAAKEAADSDASDADAD